MGEKEKKDRKRVRSPPEPSLGLTLFEQRNYICIKNGGGRSKTQLVGCLVGFKIDPFRGTITAGFDETIQPTSQLISQ